MVLNDWQLKEESYDAQLRQLERVLPKYKKWKILKYIKGIKNLIWKDLEKKLSFINRKLYELLAS